MIRKTVHILLALLGGIMGYQLSRGESGAVNAVLSSVLGTSTLAGQVYWFIGLGAASFFLLSWWVSTFGLHLIHRGESYLAKIPFSDLLAGLLGMMFGLIISALVFPVLNEVNGIGLLISISFTLILGYLGFRMGYRRKEELLHLLTLQRGMKDQEDTGPKGEHKILDTSVIIDGRISDICKTGFIEGTLVIPEFVLEELQHIADSSDLLKRNRGRRGLDILNKIQKELDVQVLIYEGDFEDISEVDSKLVKLAKLLQGKVVTNDFNLNKVCELQGVAVLNINDLANAVKPVVLPGEEIVVQVIKDGKEHGQGVAYLDDGTMIVVEGGREFIGQTMEVLVTSVLQTSAGRMIFAKPKLLEKAQ